MRVPAFYVLSRACPLSDMPQVLALLSLTPIDGVIISDVRDAPLAHEAGQGVVRVSRDEDALLMAEHVAAHNALVTLVIGSIKAGVVRMVYADRSFEEVPYASN